ncbi:uncharacterized protein LOC143018524 [Oratosquilla oratoria]|uniref:uncharacterized protein LOC143018524 n=1 Tax=Oratosquilla oratoria TaxID=337810 RepID=UPI003F758C7F
MKLNSLQNRITFLQKCIAQQVLPRSAPQHLRNGIKSFTKAAHQYLLDSIETLNKNTWKDVGRPDLIHNISSYILTQPQQQALSLSPKFETGTNTKQLSQYPEKNYKWRTNNIDIDFIQGILLCCTFAAKDRHPPIPRRFIMALNELRRNENNIITTADKGGVIVIMDKADYIYKMEHLLTDTSTYTPQSQQQAIEEFRRFSTDVRKILKRTSKGKHLLHLLEEDPKTPTISAIPKTHKAGIPMRPITNGIGNFTNKKLISPDVIALYTHTSLADAISAIQRVIDNIDETTLPINKRYYKQLVEKCLKCAFYTFNGKTHQQHDGLPMGSPLSAIPACLAMEILEQNNYKQFLPDGTTWFTYVDDYLLIIPKDTDTEILPHNLNKSHQKIQFTAEQETQDSLPYLDTLITENNSKFTENPQTKTTRILLQCPQRQN